MHYRISKFIEWVGKFPFGIGKAFAAFATFTHMGLVYQQTLRQGEAQWKLKRAKTAKQ
jgi:hypothetical protein